ncbi:MAG: hypothetical protein M1814_000576 [Vezdaea aestivalis]|nr:MAG: hypothetical protein M1814_000576 [Vezdaea aestivalis]
MKMMFSKGSLLEKTPLSQESLSFERPADLFRVLLETAASDRFAVSQQAQACAAVCALIKSGLAQKKGPLWTIVSPAVTLRPLLNICLGQSYRLKTKDTRQIFVAIHSLLTESVKQNCCLKDEVRTVLITSITSNNIHNVVKAALQILQYLVKRGIFEPQELAEALSVVEKKSSSGNNGKEASLHRFLDALLHWVPFPNLAPASGALMEVFCDSWNRAFENASYITSVELEALWITPLQAAVKESRDSLEAFKNHVFPGLFKLCRRHTESYLLQVGLREFLAGSTMDISAFELFCAALEVSKESGLVEEVDFDGDNRVADHQPSRIFDSGKAHIPSTAISIFVSHKSSQIRISALSLLITSTSTTQPFSGVVLRTMASNFTHFINEPDAKMRQDILGQMLRVLKRVRGACLFLRNKQKRLNDRAQKDDIGTIQHEVLQMIIDRHKAFLTKVLCKAIDGMNPSANYPSLSFSLGFFEMLMQSGIDPSIYQNRKVKEDAKQWGWPFHLDLFETKTLKRRKNPINSDWLQVDPNSSTALRCLQDLIMNPYEDIRATASRLLSDWCTSQAISVNCTVDYSNFRCRGQSKADSSGRADIADGLGRIYVNDYKNQAHSIGPNQCAMKSTPVSMVEDLVSLLESKITTAASDLGHAVRSTPMHAELHGIRYLDFDPVKRNQLDKFADIS